MSSRLGKLPREYSFISTYTFEFRETDTTTNAGPTLVGAMLFMGGIGLMVAAILEWVLGK